MVSKVTEREEAEGHRGIVDGLEYGFTLLLLLIAVISLVGITLAEFHLYRWITLLSASLLIGGPVLVFTSHQLRAYLTPTRLVPTLSWLYLLFILFAGAAMFFQPGEYLFNGSDGSVYVNIGSVIERTGGITFANPLLDTVPQSTWAGLFTQDENWPHLYNRFPGGVQIAEDKNLILPNFFHLFPVWIANFNLLFGPRGGFYVNAVFGLLSVVALWLLGRRLCSPLAGALGAGLLLVNFGTLWYARFPTSEVLTQFFLLAGLYFTVLCVDGAPRVVGLAAGVAFGLAAFCRIDVLFLASPLILAFLGVVALEGKFSRLWWWYLAGFVVLTGHAVAHAFMVATPYTLRVLSNIGVLTTGSLFSAATLVIGGALLWAVLLLRRRYWAWLKSHALIFAVAALGFLAFRLWPHFWSGSLWFLLSPIGVAAAFAGVAVFLVRDSTLRGLPVIAVFLCSALFYLESPRAYPFMPWVFRRYVPVILPMALLFIGYLVDTIWSSRARLRALIILIPALLGMTFFAKDWPILRDPPMRNAYAAVSQFSAQFPPTALLLFDGSVPSHLPLAVDYTFERPGLAIYRLDDMSAALRDLISRMLAADRSVYVVTTGQNDPEENTLRRSDVQEFALYHAGTFPLRYTALEWTQDIFPQVVRPIEQRLEFYQMLPWGNSPAPITARFEIDIGGLDFPYLLSGFSYRETWGTTTIRWSRGEAQILLPPPALPPGRQAILALRAIGGRPAGIEPPLVTLTMNGTSVGLFTAVTQSLTEYRFPLPAHLLAQGRLTDLVLTLRTSTFVPKVARLSDDSRELGIALDWVAVEEEP